MRNFACLAALLGLVAPQLAFAQACPRDADGVRTLLAGRKVIGTQKQGGFAQDGFTTYEGSGLVLGLQPLEYELQTKNGHIRELRIYVPGTDVAPYSYGFRNAHSGATCASGECKWEKSGTALGALRRATMMETIYKRGAMTLWCFYTNDAGW